MRSNLKNTMSVRATFEQQYAALQHGRALAILSEWSSFTISGADARRFVNNFCTNDVKLLAPGDYRETFFTDVKGRIIGHGVLYAHGERLIFIGPPYQSAALIEHLDRYIIRDDVQLHDSTAKFQCVFVSQRPDENDSRPIAADIIPWPRVGLPDSGILLAPVQETERLLDTLRELGYLAVDSEAFAAARIEAGLPLFGVDFDSSNFPQEVNRDREAISFTKGCYLGQETVARIDALGHVNKHITGVRFNHSEVPPIGTELTFSGRVVGTITSAAFSPQLGTALAMAMIRREATTSGAHLESSAGECEVITLPIL
jgi:folate-binding protein YgfZ